ncbi:MAG TPA: NAD(+)/NADH kinase [Thermoplasmata archaeon]|jgi:NAD+ kinase|nr:NAD(+)/NADH kinase [Thermoplasmata archaeon]
MRLGLIAAKDAASKRVGSDLAAWLHERFAEVSIRHDVGPTPPDVLVVIGDDHFVLDALAGSTSSPVLVLGDGFLAEAPVAGAEDALRRVLAGDHWVEERLRLQATVGGKKLPPAMNEVALNAGRGGGFLRYSLEIDGELVWRDGGDGLIVATPTGSTGYGLSAGGPVVMENAEALVVVPICSATGQKPLVIPHTSGIAIREVESRVAVELVLDGQRRIRVRSSGFSVGASEHPARFVRLGKARYLRVFGKLRARKASPLPRSAPPSAKFLHRLLEDQGALTERQLIAESGLPERTVRNALTYLTRASLVRRAPSLRDAREAIFALVE